MVFFKVLISLIMIVLVDLKWFRGVFLSGNLARVGAILSKAVVKCLIRRLSLPSALLLL